MSNDNGSEPVLYKKCFVKNRKIMIICLEVLKSLIFKKIKFHFMYIIISIVIV